MPEMPDLGSLPLFQNSLFSWLVAAAAAAATSVVLLAVRTAVRRYAKKVAATEDKELFEIPAIGLSRVTFLFTLIVGVAVGFQFLKSGPKSQQIVISAVTIACFWQAGLCAVAAASAWLTHKKRYSMKNDRAAIGSLGIIGFIASVVIWSLVVLLTLDNLGINITALVAGLGIGGIAVALALQNVLGDLFASLSIALDQPFVVGDFLIIDDFMGSVESIGIKSTRLRSLSGEQIIMANGDILKSRVRNYGRMAERRVVFAIGVTYDTPVEMLERIPQIIKSAVTDQKDTRFDRSHFQKYGDWSLDFETVYFVLNADYNKYMDIQQAINLRLYREFTALGIDFAFPTRTIHVAGDDGAANAGPAGGHRPRPTPT
jgi:small-conductance mechanosensitive channel